MPKIKGKILTAFEQTFIIRCAKLWNKLPTELMLEEHYKSFLYKLDKWLELFPDEPPVQGYFHRSRNSLLDYNTQTYKSTAIQLWFLLKFTFYCSFLCICSFYQWFIVTVKLIICLSCWYLLRVYFLRFSCSSKFYLHCIFMYIAF